MNKILIDTNIYSNFLYGQAEAIKILKNSSSIGITVISIGELLSGFEAGSKIKENKKQLYFFLDSPRVETYEIDEETCVFYSNVINNLKKKGKPIPTNDIWIAAICFQQGLPLYTQDKHFLNIDGLILI